MKDTDWRQILEEGGRRLTRKQLRRLKRWRFKGIFDAQGEPQKQCSSSEHISDLKL